MQLQQLLFYYLFFFKFCLLYFVFDVYIIWFLRSNKTWLSECSSLSKLVSAIFYQIFIFSPNDSPSKTMKNVFILSKKVFLFSRYSSFCSFFPFLSTLSRFKKTNGSGIIYDVMNWLA